VLAATGAVFLALGLAFLVDPERMAAIVGIVARHPKPSTEVRAMYGGLEIGLGSFFLVASVRLRWIRAALAAQSLVLGSLCLGRLIGMALTNPSDRTMLSFALFEATGALIGLLAFRRAKEELLHRPRSYE
jgi:hypothetical protein